MLSSQTVSTLLTPKSPPKHDGFVEYETPKRIHWPVNSTEFLTCIMNGPRNGDVSLSEAISVQAASPRTSSSVESRKFFELSPPPATIKTWKNQYHEHWYENEFSFYLFIVTVYVITATMKISAHHEVRQVLLKSLNCINWDKFWIVLTASKDNLLFELDGTMPPDLKKK